jgi:MscS family membrane protein
LEFFHSFMDLLQNFLIMGPLFLKNFILALLVFLFFLVTKKFFTEVIFKLLLKVFFHTHLELAEKILLSFKKPMQFFFVILGFYLAINCFPLSLEKQILISKLFRTVLVFLFTWGLYDLSDVDSVLFKKIQDKANIQLDKILFSFISKFIKIILVLIAITIIAQEWDYDINGLIAGLGLGGLAFALAAQDSLSNIFGGIVIVFDKPFSIGDWVKTPSVEGTVEELGFRSTKIRTFDQSLVTVPNSTLAKESINNRSKRGKRQITFNLRIAITTPREKIENCISRIKAMLKEHPGVHQETIFVSFDNFGEDSLMIFLYFFTKTTVWGEYLQVKEDINLKIMGILEEEGVTIALPSRKIIYDHPEKAKSAFKA